MPHSRSIRSVFWALVLLLGVSRWQLAHAQVSEGDLIYKFQVEGVSAPEIAKPVQYFLLDHDFVTSCTFISECSCFKLATVVPLSHSTLTGLLNDGGYALQGEVRVSDGSVWRSAQDHLKKQ